MLPKSKRPNHITGIEIQESYHGEPFVGSEPVMTQDIIMTASKKTKYTYIDREIIISIILN